MAKKKGKPKLFSIKKFDGKNFKLSKGFSSKSDAQNYANGLKKRGLKFRIKREFYNVGNRRVGQYNVYRRAS